MRFLTVSTPRGGLPPEQLPAMFDGAMAWEDRHRDHIEILGMFPGGGGFAIFDVPDEQTLYRMVAEMPFTPFSDILVRPFVDSQIGWGQAKEAVQGMLEAMRGA